MVLIHWISSVCSTIQEVQWTAFHLTGTISHQGCQISMVMGVFMSMYWDKDQKLSSIFACCILSKITEGFTVFSGYQFFVVIAVPQSRQGRQSQWVWFWAYISPEEASWRDLPTQLASGTVAVSCPLCVPDRQVTIMYYPWVIDPSSRSVKHLW